MYMSILSSLKFRVYLFKITLKVIGAHVTCIFYMVIPIVLTCKKSLTRKSYKINRLVMVTSSVAIALIFVYLHIVEACVYY